MNIKRLCGDMRFDIKIYGKTTMKCLIMFMSISGTGYWI